MVPNCNRFRPRPESITKFVYSPANQVMIPAMATNLEDIRELVTRLPASDKARLLAMVAVDLSGAFPGIDFRDGVCGGVARIVRTRIPVWTLEAARRNGMSDAAVLAAFPTLTAEDLANAWQYARSHRAEIESEIAANSDEQV